MPILKIKDENGNWIDLATANTHEHAISDITGLPASIVDDVEALKDKVGAESVAYQINSVLKSSEYVHPFTHPADMITGLSDVAISGSYADLKDTPDIASEQVQADWEQDDETATDYIKNKPVIPDEYTHPNTHPASMIEGLALVAKSGNYNDLINRPEIPSIAGLATITYVDEKFASAGGSGGGMTEQVQADWDETDTTSPAYIKNKPVISGDGSASVQANWDQTDDTQADYIKNKPFYEYEGFVDVLPVKTYDGFWLNSSFNVYNYQELTTATFTIGDTYTVHWDGNDYECTAQDAGSILSGAVALGNCAPFGLMGNNEPFILAIMNGGLMCASLTDTQEGGSHIIGVKQKETLIKKLDSKFSPVPFFGEGAPSLINLFPTSILKFTFNNDEGYMYYFSPSEEQAKLWNSDWNTANVIWDGIEYTCNPQLSEGEKFIGNENTPFVMWMNNDMGLILSLTDSAEEIHTDNLYSSVQFSLVDGQNYYACTDEIRTIPLVDGTKYYIKWNTDYYEDIEAKSYTSSEATYIAVGNPSILGLGDDNGKEFFIYTKTLPDGTQNSGIVTTSSISEISFAIYYAPNTEHNFEVSVDKNEIVTIDPKYIGGTSWDRVTDRPFYEIPVGTIVLDENIEIINNEDAPYTILKNLNKEYIIKGARYSVIIDGATYISSAVDSYPGNDILLFEILDDDQNRVAYIMSGVEGQDILINYNDDILSEGAHDIKISYIDPYIVKIDPKFLPEASGSGLPEVSTSDNGKTLLVSEGVWIVTTPPKGVPDVSSTDNDKVLTVENGTWVAKTPASELPAVTSEDAGKFLRVSSDGTWIVETIQNAEEVRF